jgi:hypothetical protein
VCKVLLVFMRVWAFTDTNSGRAFRMENLKRYYGDCSLLQLDRKGGRFYAVAGRIFDATGSYHLTPLLSGMLGIIDGIVAHRPWY